LLAVISDIHRVFWVNADPVDVRNPFRQDTRPQAVSSSNLGSVFIPFFKKLTCTSDESRTNCGIFSSNIQHLKRFCVKVAVIEGNLNLLLKKSFFEDSF